MKRKHVKAMALLTAGAMALLATGCGDAQGSEPAPESKQEETGGEAESPEESSSEEEGTGDTSSEAGESTESGDDAQAAYTFPGGAP